MFKDGKQTDFFDQVQKITENYLTWRNKNRRLKREKQKTKNVILDWIEAFLWAACMVLLINQYLIQAYRIPSGSMIDTLNIGDQVFVNKIVYGPELLPGLMKLSSPIKPKRNDIIIFENTDYTSRGPVFDIAQRLIYMLTLSFVDIDKDESGDPSVHFLIKRAVGQAGDRFVLENGEMKILFAGEDRWVSEREYNAQRKWNHKITRIVLQEQYPAIAAHGKISGWTDRGIYPSEKLISKASPAEEFRAVDSRAHEKARLETLRKASPHEKRYAENYSKFRLGWYVPNGRMLPLGDNRDSSRDGRFFGPVKISRVLGKGMIIYWPLSRVNKIK